MADQQLINELVEFIERQENTIRRKLAPYPDLLYQFEGIRSIYRTIQILTKGDPEAETKHRRGRGDTIIEKILPAEFNLTRSTLEIVIEQQRRDSGMTARQIADALCSKYTFLDESRYDSIRAVLANLCKEGRLFRERTKPMRYSSRVKEEHAG